MFAACIHSNVVDGGHQLSRKEDIQEGNFNLDAKSEFKDFWTNGNGIKDMDHINAAAIKIHQSQANA